MSTGNYSGINGANLNPASVVNFHQYLDVRIASVGVTLENNYLYIGADEYRARDVFSLSPSFPEYTESHPDLGYSVELNGFDHYKNNSSKDFYVGSRVEGPGVLIVDGEMAYGFSSSLRAMVSLNNIPGHVANFAYIGLGYVPQHNIDYSGSNFGGAGMFWNEYAFILSRIFEDRYYSRISGGIAIKYLTGMTGFYASFNDLDYNMLDRSTLDIQEMNSFTGMSLPLDYNDNSFPDNNGLFKGKGISFDLGFTLLQKDKNYHRRDYEQLCQQHYNTYVYRLGISLLDLGFVRFNNNGMTHEYLNTDYLWESISSYQYHDMDFLMNDLSNRFYSNAQATYTGDVVTVYTPAAISVQGDYSFERSIFLNGTWIHPLVLNNQTIRRPAQLALVPRYERKNFEVAVPLSLYDYLYPRIGLSCRIYFLTIGTEKLGAFTGLTDFSGMDFYLSLKVSFEKGNCPGSGRKYGCGNLRFK